ncbi:exported hypothetical protein [uncultured Desulfatiglans sp.]|nr:exported hypothetical protein [uncultured Desulfatiglans sp.]
MKKLISIFILFNLLFITSFSAAAIESINNKNELILKIHFNKLLNLNEIKKFAISNSDIFTIIMLEGKFVIGGTEHYEFFLVQPSEKLYKINLENIHNTFNKYRHALFQSVLETAYELDDDIIINRYDMLESMHRMLYDQSDIPTHISKATIQTTHIQISEIIKRHTNIIQHIEIASIDKFDRNIYQDNFDQDTDETHDIYQNEKNYTENDIKTWWPNVGYSHTYQYSPTERYTLQYMGWYNPNFTEIDTYEHDYFLYNYDNATYLRNGSTSYPNCYPLIVYAATTWPSDSHPYLDTRYNYFGCEFNELAFTIGASKAKSIPGNIWHYNYFITKNGNSSSDKFKLQAQKGYRNPSWCYSTWCSFSEKIVNLVPAWSSSVPGTVRWTK